jgi:glycosyltransferase involved in cell wall biosynthesis
MNDVEISICVPTYNQTKYLIKTLESVFSQQNVNFEVIISDDSTTDDVFKLVSSYQSTYNIVYTRNNPSLGAPKNWNFAMSLSKGNYIKIMHHDEWFSSPMSLYTLYLHASKNKFNLVCSSSISIIRGTETKFFANEHDIEKINLEPTLLLLGNKIGGPSSIMFHKDLLQNFDANLIWLVDIEFYIRLINSGAKLSYIHEELYVSVISDHNITNECLYNSELNIKEYSYVFRLHIRRLSLVKQLKYFSYVLRILRIHNKTNIFILILRFFKRCYVNSI